MSGDAVELAHPLFEPTIVSIDVLNVVDLADNPNASSKIDWPMSDTDFPHGSTQSFAAVCAENCIARQQWLECLADMFLVSLLQHKIGCASGAITANQHGNLFCGQATLQCLAATLMRLARHATAHTMLELHRDQDDQTALTLTIEHVYSFCHKWYIRACR